MTECATCSKELGEAGAHIQIQDKKFCGECANEAKASYARHLHVEARKVLVSTTPNLDGYRIVRYAGSVFAACVDVLTGYADAAADITDFLGLGGRYESGIQKLHHDAEQKLRMIAAHRGAEAIVGASFDLEFSETEDRRGLLGSRDRKVMVAASGTAVNVEAL